MDKPYQLDAQVKRADGSLADFTLSVSAPRIIEPGKYACTISCPTFSFDGNQFFGENAKQAMALSLWLVDDQLRNRQLTIVGSDGSVIHLPIDRTAGIPDTTDRSQT